MAALFDKYNTGDDSGLGINTAAGYFRAQTWVATQNYTASQIKVKVYRVGNPGTVNVALWSIVAGDPSAALATGTFNGNAVTDVTTGEWVTITLSVTVAIVSGTSYAVVLDDASSDASNKIMWRTDDDAGYAGGLYKWSDDSGSTWYDQSSDDLMFEIYGVQSPTDKVYSKALVAISNDEVWYESSAGTMVELTDANGNINTNNLLTAVEAFQKLFIVNKTNLKIVDFANTRLTSEAEITTNIPSKGDILTQDSTSAELLVDYMYYDDTASDHYVYGTVISGTFNTTNDVKDSDGNTIITGANLSAVTAATTPHWYDWQVFNEDVYNYGTMPTSATLVCLYRGRLILAGNSNYPHQWWMSRQADPFDFNSASTDAQSAVVGNNTDAGEVGDIITCLIPYKDDYLLFGCASSIWLLVGDPRRGGTLSEFSLTTGIFGANSFCWDNEDNLYFWGINGIYKSTIPGKPVCITREALPDIIKDEAVNVSTHRITMKYDNIKHGIQICITTLADGTNSNYFYDLSSEGFFPETYPEECGVYSAHFYNAEDPDYRAVIYGCYDGYLRVFDDSAADDVKTDDTGEAIDSHVAWGPLLMAGNPKHEGKITGLDCVTAGGAASGSQSDSDDIECKIFTAKSAEEIVEKLSANSAPVLTKTINAPGRRRGNTIKRKLRGVYAGIRLGNSIATEKWGFEQLLVDSKMVGRFK
jgi:hypothetical protein